MDWKPFTVVHEDCAKIKKELVEYAEGLIAKWDDLPFFHQDADKQFYVVLIRHFHKDHPILQPNYCPPAKPKKEKQSQFTSHSSIPSRKSGRTQ